MNLPIEWYLPRYGTFPLVRGHVLDTWYQMLGNMYQGKIPIRNTCLHLVIHFVILILTSDSMTAPNSGLPIKWADFRFWMSLMAGIMGPDNWLEVFQGNSSKAPRKAEYNSVLECPRLLSISFERSSWTMSPGTASRGGVQVSQSLGCSNSLTLPRFRVPTSNSLNKKMSSQWDFFCDF